LINVTKDFAHIAGNKILVNMENLAISKGTNAMTVKKHL
jgi:hypothetical protein